MQSKMTAASVEFDLPLLLLDKFDSANFLWNGTGTGAGWICSRNAAAAYEGDAGMELVTRAAGSLAGDTVTAQRYAFITPTTKLSLSSLFRLNQSTAFNESIIWQLKGRIGDHEWNTAIRYRGAAWAWDYQNDTGGWTEFIDNQNQGLDVWNRLYFEIDLSAMQYLTIKINEHKINLQGTAIQDIILFGLKYLELSITAESRLNGTPADISIDNVILKELGG